MLHPLEGTHYLVYFKRADRKRTKPLDFLLNRDFAHVAHVLVLDDAEKTFIAQELTYEGQFFHTGKWGIEGVKKLLKGDITAVQKVTKAPYGKYRPQLLHTCVTMCQSRVGLRLVGAWTPKQLFNRLRLKDGVETWVIS